MEHVWKSSRDSWIFPSKRNIKAVRQHIPGKLVHYLRQKCASLTAGKGGRVQIYYNNTHLVLPPERQKLCLRAERQRVQRTRACLEKFLFFKIKAALNPGKLLVKRQSGFPHLNFYRLHYVLGQQISAVPHHGTLNCNVQFWGTFFRGRRAGQEEEDNP